MFTVKYLYCNHILCNILFLPHYGMHSMENAIVHPTISPGFQIIHLLWPVLCQNCLCCMHWNSFTPESPWL